MSQAPITPDLVSRTPVVETIPAPAPAAPVEKVEFSPEQQAKLDQIIRDAQGRAARELRTKLLEVEATNATLKQQLEVSARAHAADATSDDIHAAELQQRDLRIKELEQDKQRQARDAAARLAAERAGFVSADQALRLIDVPQDADTATVEAAIKTLAEKNEHLLKGTMKSGTGSTRADRPVAVEYQLQELFGPKSNSRAANELAIRDHARYTRLRNEAKKKGLVS